MRGVSGRTRQRGSQTLEFFAVLPLLVLASLCIWQGLVLLQQRSEANADARALARAAAICTKPDPTLSQVDADAAHAGGTAVLDRRLLFVTAKVKLVPQSLLQGVDLGTAGIGLVTGSATFRQEPCS